MAARRSSRSRSKPRSKRDGEGSGSESESAPEPSPAELSSEEEEFAESQQAGARVLERAEELEKIKKQQRETGEGLAALRQRFEDQGVAVAESAAEVKGLLQQLIATTGTQASPVKDLTIEGPPPYLTHSPCVSQWVRLGPDLVAGIGS